MRRWPYSITLLAIVMGLLSLSCTDLGVEGSAVDDPNFEVPQNKSLEQLQAYVIGEWEWAKSIRWTFSDTYTYTPQSTGERVQLVFSSDGTAQYSLNNSLRYEEPYEVEEPYPGRYTLTILGHDKYNDLRANSLFLTVNTAYFDGPVDYYVRKK